MVPIRKQTARDRDGELARPTRGIFASQGATILLSEDMHDGLEIEGLKIVNPFVIANEILLADYFGSVA